MRKPAASLKSKNALYLWTFITVNSAVALIVFLGRQLNYGSIDEEWKKLSARNGIFAASVPILAIVLGGILSDLVKARLVFWRFKFPLPGCRVFSDLMHTDHRIDISVIKKRYGPLPRAPKEQNVLWFKLYKRHEKKITVSEGHRLYLLTRDMASMAAILIIIACVAMLFVTHCDRSIIIYVVVLVVQYLVLAATARNYGNRFVLNVLTEESHAGNSE